jgi:hypothetical protein
MVIPQPTIHFFDGHLHQTPELAKLLNEHCVEEEYFSAIKVLVHVSVKAAEQKLQTSLWNRHPISQFPN